jgi:ABC-type amino acid transport substrate-binding protein
MKRISIVAIWILLSGSLFAKTITIGALPFNPPFEMRADSENHLYGFDIDIMNGICSRMKAKCKFIPMHFDDLFKNLLKGKIDLAMSGITITGFRKKQFIFSLPYMLSYGRLLTLRDSSIYKFSDVPGKVLGVEKGTMFKTVAKKLFPKDVTIKEYELMSDLIDALHRGKVDVVLIDNPAAIYWLVQNSDEFQLIGKKIRLGIGIGIMSIKKNLPLIRSINKNLLKMEADGSYEEIYKRYYDK